MPDKSNKKQSERGQMLSDKRARLVTSGKMTYAQAKKLDDEDDAKTRTIVSVSKTTSGSSQKLPTKRKSTKPKFSYDRNGKLVAN